MRKNKNHSPVPHILYAGETAETHVINPKIAADTMAQLGVSNQTIESTTLYPNSDNHFAVNGTTYPKVLGRLRHISHSHLRHAPGPVVRISTKMRGKERSEDDINRTVAHELIHVAQMDRHDLRLKIGFLAQIGTMALGGAVGNKLGGQNTYLSAFGTIVGMAVGQRIGYRIDPAEHQARALSKNVHPPIVQRQ